MAILKIKDETGKFVDIPAIQGAPGKDGAIQYEAGENIKIEGNVISASGGNKNYSIYTEYDGAAAYDYKKEFMTPVIEDMKNGKTVIIVTKNVTDIYAYNFGSDIFVSPKLNNIDLNTYSGAIYFKTCKYYFVKEHSVRNYRIQYEPTYCQFVVTLTNGQITAVSNIGQKSSNSDGVEIPVLKNNTAEYTPTKDYHPATYKFVKDEITKAITTTLEGEY